MILKGRLVLVVGPSGAGKDTLLRGARALFADRPEIAFPQREITRAVDDLAEDFVSVTPAQFEARERSGGYVLSWRAHGLAYGVPTAILDDLGAGRTVVLNVSRAVVDNARDLGWPVTVAQVSASAATRRERLIKRAREADEALDGRLQDTSETVSGPGVFNVQNEGGVDEGVRRLADIIELATAVPEDD
jgi:phosphonate metabolism protein PhnN/1,5-bisphosphokinase (PRPP-forming)